MVPTRPGLQKRCPLTTERQQKVGPLLNFSRGSDTLFRPIPKHGPSGYLVQRTSHYDNRSKRLHRESNRPYVSLVVVNMWPMTLTVGTKNKDWLESTRSGRSWGLQRVLCKVLTRRTFSRLFPGVFQGFTTPSTYGWRLSEKEDIFGIKPSLRDTPRHCGIPSPSYQFLLTKRMTN